MHRHNTDTYPVDNCGSQTEQFLRHNGRILSSRANEAMHDIHMGMQPEDVIQRNIYRELHSADISDQCTIARVMHYCLDSRDRFKMHTHVCNINGGTFIFHIGSILANIKRISITSTQLIINALNYIADNIPVTITIDELGASSANSYNTYNQANRFHFIYTVLASALGKITLQPSMHDELQLGYECNAIANNTLTVRLRWLTDEIIVPSEFLEVTINYENPVRIVCIDSFAHNLISGVDKVMFMNFKSSVNFTNYYVATVLDETSFTLPIDMTGLASDPNRPGVDLISPRTYNITFEYIGNRQFRSQWYHYLQPGDIVSFNMWNSYSINGDGLFTVESSSDFIFTLIMRQSYMPTGVGINTNITVITRNYTSTVVMHVANRRIILPLKFM